MDEATPKQSPLHDRHVALGAKMAPFAGWEMPLEYSGAGVVAEHTAVRTGVGIFDVSHLGKLAVTGTGAAEFVNTVLTNDVTKIGPGRAQYTLCCDDETGGVVDDMIIYLRSGDHVFVVPNAANTDDLEGCLKDAAPAGVRVENVHERFATVAVQGPRSAEVVEALGLPSGGSFMTFTEVDWRGQHVLVCRSGYTGEHGYELMPGSDGAPELWDAVVAAGETYGVQPCGLGARDTLRTEAGLPLHGQDLTPDITPVQARLSWAVGWKKPEFWGREVLAAERERGPSRRLWGVKASGRGIPRPHMRVLDGSGQPAGELTSGTFSPTLKTGIGLALIDSSLGEGDEVSVDVRGRQVSAQVVKPPFVQPAK